MNREQMIARQQALINAARSGRRDLTADETAEFDELQRQIDALDAANAAAPAAAGAGAPAADAAGATRSAGHEMASTSHDDMAMAIQEERGRIREITSLCREFEMDPGEYIERGTGIDEVRSAVLDHVRQNGAPISTRATVVSDKADKFRAAASDAMLLRSGLNVENPADGASNMQGLSLRDLAIESLQQDGTSVSGLNRRSSDDIYTMLQRGFFTPEATFPAILDQTIEKAYKEGHKKAAVTFDMWTKKGSLKDFKTHDNYYIAGPVGEFKEVGEDGELKHDTFKDDKLPTRKLRTYGKSFSLSRKAFIDDDIGLVTSIPSRYAASARRTINSQVYKILIGNPAIYDGLTLFGSDHKNLVKTGTGITQEAMQTMIMALSNQKDQFDEAIIINPGTIIVPSGMQFDMYTLFNSPTINTSDNTQAVNPLFQYRDKIGVVEDPTINVLCGGMGNVMPWFLAGAQGDTDFIEVDYLNGQEIPNIRRMEAPGQLGFVWDIFLDWGISVMDFRGCVKNPGVTVKTKLDLA